MLVMRRCGENISYVTFHTACWILDVQLRSCCFAVYGLFLMCCNGDEEEGSVGILLFCLVFIYHYYLKGFNNCVMGIWVFL